MAKALSGLQKDVIHLYRKCVRESMRKGEERAAFLQYTREQFGRFRALDRKDFHTIEYLLRAGSRRLDMLSNPNITRIR